MTIFVLGLPTAFLLWHWRDRNVRDQIDNTRKDINLKEFQEVQLRASGALDKDIPEVAREQLQIAALHQLRGFLRGEYGDSFKRPAFELFCSGLAQTDVLSFGEWRTMHSPTGENLRTKYIEYVDQQQKLLSKVSLTRNKIISEEWRYIFRSGFPLHDRNFSFVMLPIDADLSSLDLTSCRFIRARLGRVKFNKATMRFTILDRAFADGADFSDVQFFGASLICSALSTNIRDDIEPRAMPADFRNAELGLVHFNYAVVHGAQLQGTKFYTNDIQDAHFDGCQFDENTEFDKDWSHKTSEQKDAIRQIWLDRGAVRVD